MAEDYKNLTSAVTEIKNEIAELEGKLNTLRFIPKNNLEQKEEKIDDLEKTYLIEYNGLQEISFSVNFELK